MAVPREKCINPIGDGNCGYSAYANSLMAYLRFHPEVKETVFNNLLLPEEIRTQLNVFLDYDNKNKKNWTDSEWKDIASRLRQPLRNLAAARTAAILKEWADDTNNASNANKYLPIIGTASMFEEMILQKENSRHMTLTEGLCSNLKKIISHNDRHDIERVSAITDGIKKYVNKHAGKITETNITNHAATFLKSNKYLYIKLYEQRLKTDRIWVCEETLSLLHKAVFNRCDEPQTEITDEATRKEMQKSKDYKNTEQKIRIINQNNRHWVSYIPGEFLINKTDEESHPAVPEPAAITQTVACVPSIFQQATRLGKTAPECLILTPPTLIIALLFGCAAIGMGITSVGGALLLCIAAIFLAATLALTVNHIYESSFSNKR